jgi:hypothetical protein
MSPLRYIVPLLAGLAGVAGGYGLMHSVGPKLKTTTNGSQVGSSSGSGEPPKVSGGDEQSMLRPEELAKALAVIRKQGGGPGTRLSDFRLAPERVNTTVDGDGKQQMLYLIPGGKIYTSNEIQNSNSFPEDDFAVATIPAGAPWRMVQTLQRTKGISPDDVDYMVLEKFSGGRPEWLLYLKNISRSYYRAALNGAHPTKF